MHNHIDHGYLCIYVCMVVVANGRHMSINNSLTIKKWIIGGLVFLVTQSSGIGTSIHERHLQRHECLSTSIHVHGDILPKFPVSR